MLLEAPILPTLLRLAAPNAVVMVTQISIPLVEIYFIAKISIDALAGVSEVFPVLSLVGAISQGAVGGGVVSAIARTLGSGERTEANNLVWYAVGIAVSLGLITTAIVLGLGSVFYAAMGGHDLSLSSALTYSNFIFAGAVLIWLFNLLLAVIRGTGNLIVPLIVVCGGALLLLPLLPVLILGFGPIPGLGVTGGAIGILTYYAAGCLALVTYLWGHRGVVLAPPARPPMLRLRPIWEILRVGGMSALLSASTNITLATLTGFVGTNGVAALAGYGAGSRLEFMLVSLSYGIGGPAGILIGTNIGAGNTDRALRVAWMGTLISVCTAEAIGLAVACWPMVWLGAFSRDPSVIAVGSAYLRTVGPFFGFFGMGFALYCAGQGTGRMGWPATGALVRAAIAVMGGVLALHVGVGLDQIFLAAGVGMAAFGCLSLLGLILRVGYVGRSGPRAGDWPARNQRRRTSWLKPTRRPIGVSSPGGGASGGHVPGSLGPLQPRRIRPEGWRHQRSHGSSLLMHRLLTRKTALPPG
jgi:putative MATE family efflux protein